MKDLFYPTHPPIKGARRVMREGGKNPRAEQKAEYYRANKERIKATQAAYYQAHREEIIKRVRSNQEAAPHQHAARHRVYARRKRLERATIANPD